MLAIVKKETLSNWMFYFLFLTSIDTCLFGTNENYAFRLVPRIVGFIFVIYMLFSNRILRLNKKLTCVFGIMVTIQTISSVINQEMISTYISRILFFVVAYVIVINFSFEKFGHFYVDFLYFVSIIALILEIVAYIAPSLIRILPSIVNTEGQIFFSCFFGAIHENSFNRLLIRSSSIFWEPGAYAVYLIFGLIIEWFCRSEFNNKYNVVFLIALLTTFSTTGYIAVLILMITFIFSKKEIRNQKAIKLLFGIVLTFMLLYFLNPESDLYQIVFAKIQNNSSSVITRYSSIYNGMKIALSHPILGVASNTEFHMGEIIYSENALFTSGGLIITNTIVGQFACYGMFYGLLYFYGLSKFCKKIQTGKIVWLGVLLAIVASFSGERFFSCFAYIWMLYGYKQEKI